MKRYKYGMSAYHADNALGGCRKRTLRNMARKAGRSAAAFFRGIGKGVIGAIKAWTESSPARGY